MQLQKECAFTLLGIECSQICWKTWIKRKTHIQRLRGEKHEPYITGWKLYYFAKRNLRTAGLEKEYGMDWRGWFCALETRFFILGEGKLGNTCSQGQGLGFAPSFFLCSLPWFGSGMGLFWLCVAQPLLTHPMQCQSHLRQTLLCVSQARHLKIRHEEQPLNARSVIQGSLVAVDQSNSMWYC